MKWVSFWYWDQTAILRSTVWKLATQWINAGAKQSWILIAGLMAQRGRKGWERESVKEKRGRGREKGAAIDVGDSESKTGIGHEVLEHMSSDSLCTCWCTHTYLEKAGAWASAHKNIQAQTVYLHGENSDLWQHICNRTCSTPTYTHVTGMPARYTCVTKVPAVMESSLVHSSNRVKFAPVVTCPYKHTPTKSDSWSPMEWMSERKHTSLLE